MLNFDFQAALKRLSQFKSPEVDRVPSIPLYMDQVLSYLDSTLRPLEVHGQEPCYTKAMINNYVKSGVLEPPHKKKYNHLHLMVMTMVFRLKKALAIKDIQALFGVCQAKGLDAQRVARCYDYYKAAELRVAQELAAMSATRIGASDVPLEDEALLEQIIGLAVEVDAKGRLAEAMMLELREKRHES